MNPSAHLIFNAIDNRKPDAYRNEEWRSSVKMVWNALLSVCGNTASIAHSIEVLIFLCNHDGVTINESAKEFGISAQRLHPRFMRVVQSGLVQRYRHGPRLEWHYKISDNMPFEYIFDSFIESL